jgi:adenosylhomocysteine nucleosidase
MKIGIISAVPEEIKTIHDDIHFSNSVEHVERQFYFGKYETIELVLVYSRVGKVAASITAAALIEKFKVDKIIFTGLAGAVSKELERGSIILCDKTYQHDLDARPLCEQQFEVPLTGRRLFKLDAGEISLAKNAIDNFLTHLYKYVDLKELERLNVKKPKLYIGTIATGDQFIEDVAKQKNLTVKGIEAMAVEMEGAAVAQVCAEYKVPYTLIRIISDKADNSAIISLQEFSIKLASHYASGIIQEILKLLV